MNKFCFNKKYNFSLKKIFLLLIILFSSVNLFSLENFYWEKQKVISNGDCRFPRTLASQNKSFVFWQEVSSNNQIYISCRIYKTPVEYEDRLRFAGPFTYSGEVPDLYSVEISDKGTILVAVAESVNGISVYSSTNDCESFEYKKIPTSSAMIAPRIYFSANGKFRLFASSVYNDVFQLYCSESKDGKDWSSFRLFSPGLQFRNAFYPVSLIYNNQDVVVFQAQNFSSSLNRYSYQLFVTTTRDGHSWSNPVLLTDEESLPDSVQLDYAAFQNQRPNIINFQNKLYLTWERTESVNSSIWVTQITPKGIIPKTFSQITENSNASRAMFFEYHDILFLEWFDNRSGNDSVYLSQKKGEDWEELSLIQNKYNNMFSTPLFMYNLEGEKKVAIVLQQVNGNDNKIGLLAPDSSVDLPKIINSTNLQHNRGKDKNITFNLIFPSDTSGIQGYSYTWQKVPQPEEVQEILEPKKEVEYNSKNRSINVYAPEDGEYILQVRLKDNAGNWSYIAKEEYKLDLTPPSNPEVKIAQTDEFGFLPDNTFNLEWEQSQDSDVAGYTYSLEYIAEIPKTFIQNKTHSVTLSEEQIKAQIESIIEDNSSKINKKSSLPQYVITNTCKTKDFLNAQNGFYKFTVCAVDDVGNLSEPSTMIIVLNKYRPQTFISSAYQKSSKLGQHEIIINGGGFLYEGTISKICIDKDGDEPFDLVLEKDKGDYRVRSDSLITDIKISNNLLEGKYKIILYHTDRGKYVSNNILSISKNGTLKIESEYEYVPKYKMIQSNYKFTIFAGVLLLTLLLIFIFTVLFIFTYILIKARKDKKLILTEIKALISGEIMPLLKTKKKASNKKSLRAKLVGFSVALVITVALIVTLQNGYQMITSQEKIMAEGIQNRIDVLLESLSSGVKNFLPTENDLEIGALPSQKDAMAEVKYVTILGKRKEQTNIDNINNKMVYVWASNDPDIDNKVVDYQQTGIVAGETMINDESLIQITKKLEGLNERVKASVSNTSEQIASFSTKITELAGRTDTESVKRRAEYSEVSSRLRSELNSTLNIIAQENSNSLPMFTYNILSSQNTDYIFYKPVLYRSGTSNNYVHAIIVAEVSIKNLQDQLKAEIYRVIIIAAISAFAAILLGAFGAWILASLIVKPIKKLEGHLQKVGTLMTKSVRERQRLEKEYIEISTKDEIGRLGDVVNKMTLSAGQAAYEEFLQLDGKAVQERFIPLADGNGGRKLPIVKFKDKGIDLFAFYKGDSAVSGDYFDYKKLDDQWYVFIKCDISGHGVPAALLVSVVATKFKDFYYFSNWNIKKDGINLKKFVSAVNDFIFDLGTKGKFSTVNISLFNKNTGELFICNAGDNKIHILDGATKQLKEVVLSNSPTAGGVSTDLVEMTAGGFKIEKLILKPGDTLYLYTDGIDEAERYVRNRDYEVKVVNGEEQKEQFGNERIKSIIEAVVKKQKYELVKQESPNVSEHLIFDFNNSVEPIEDSILALASIERVFRMRKPDNLLVSDEIEIDNIVDEFLKKYFNLYSKYCIPADALVYDKNLSKQELDRLKQMEDPNVTKYTYIQEDKQADDITLIAIKRS